jgi:hypothetical protein
MLLLMMIENDINNGLDTKCNKWDNGQDRERNEHLIILVA